VRQIGELDTYENSNSREIIFRTWINGIILHPQTLKDSSLPEGYIAFKLWEWGVRFRIRKIQFFQLKIEIVMQKVA